MMVVLMIHKTSYMKFAKKIERLIILTLKKIMEKIKYYFTHSGTH